MKNRINVVVNPKMKTKLEEVGKVHGLKVAEIVRRGIIEQIDQLERISRD